MSRIHDALKRAEDQRLANLGLNTEPMIKESMEVSLTSVYGDEAHNREVAPERAPIESGLRTGEDILRKCVNTKWSPSKDALFLATEDSNSPGLEEFRSLRSKLFQMRGKQSLKTILVSSALPSEGKSFVSTNLAQAFARQRGGRTLLIDSDLRKPHIHEVLGAASSPGLYEFLSGKATESEILQKSDRDDLFFIPAGKVDSKAAELIGNGRMKLLLEKLAPLFNWIVVDSSPVIPVSDATRIAELCDGVLLVVRAGSTPSFMAERAKREFQHSPLIGVVFNQVARREDPYYKYSYSQAASQTQS